MSIVSPLMWIILFYLPTVFVVWRAVKAKNAYEAEAEEPFSDSPLRLPGESTRLAAEKHYERATEFGLLLLVTSAVLGMGVAMSPERQRPLTAALFGTLMVGLSVWAGIRAMRSLRLYWNYHLGFKGERYVAEELNPLLSHGWRVFHDVPFEGFNIDHIAVGPLGVFAVETKTKRKWKDRATNHPAHIVKWNGQVLTWPSGAQNTFGLDQAERNARTVSEWLSKAIGEPVGCQPVLTLPGWFITFEGRGTVIVAASKGLHRVLLKCGSAALSSVQVDRLAYQLEQRCRPE